MNRRQMLVCVLMGLGLMIGMTQLATADEAKTMSGKITKIADDGGSFTLQDDNGDDTEISVNDDTTYSLNGEDSNKDATVKVNAAATVKVKDGTAMKVSVSE
ncbi:MAG: hypothetical protein GC159_13785 [Phycisphaera sp.]|nr:hypothetical protein [Phycisphaera sp.]